jgi:lysozyme
MPFTFNPLGWFQTIVGPSPKPITTSDLPTPVPIPISVPKPTVVATPQPVRAGLSLVKEFEGCKLTAYQDGGGVWTIGYGFTAGVHAGMTMTQAEADARLIVTYDQFESEVKNLVTVGITENELGALTCFTYNLGETALAGSTLLKLLNAGSPKATVAAQFGLWNHDNGQVVAGLTRRRAAEAALFLQA